VQTVDALERVAARTEWHIPSKLERTMKIRPVAYWVATALTAFAFLSGGATDLARPAALMEGMNKLGYPPYFVLILGVWKILGGIVVLTPGTPRLKEWAYAGMVFDLTGAAASHAAVGDPVGKIVTPLIICGIVMASWALRPASRKPGDARVEPTLQEESLVTSR
jgi:uncharacterized membrane protein YphA (DoxX/SURF4 family)